MSFVIKSGFLGLVSWQSTKINLLVGLLRVSGIFLNTFIELTFCHLINVLTVLFANLSDLISPSRSHGVAIGILVVRLGRKLNISHLHVALGVSLLVFFVKHQIHDIHSHVVELFVCFIVQAAKIFLRYVHLLLLFLLILNTHIKVVSDSSINFSVDLNIHLFSKLLGQFLLECNFFELNFFENIFLYLYSVIRDLFDLRVTSKVTHPVSEHLFVVLLICVRVKHLLSLCFNSFTNLST
mmetsp:Transcript_33717/g.45375  ORF Transcript_33717/g.45375 Transcript_33717/m.45375 type:complete len:239 (+) Transcript_33717:655-1371(+)